MNKQKIKIRFSIVLVLLLSMGFSGQIKAQEFPKPMNPPRMVNDFAGLINKGSATSLEKKLQDFYYSSSTQIYIITVDDLMGYDPSDYATRISEEWEVGTKDKDNGIVILVKPKTSSSSGQVYISVGYGLEGAVPDITASRIVNTELLPNFQQDNIAGGLEAGVNTLISLTQGEFTADEYMERTGKSGGFSFGAILFLIFLVMAIFGGGSKSRRNGSVGRNLPFWLLLSMMGSGSRSHGGSFGGFSGGSGGFGGGGGGSFGGGGAGGSW